jgi:asparagine synthase (glutamine-hydrolysing)
MCGIAGIVAPRGQRPERSTLAAMSAALAHRGPDDSQVTTYERAGFAFRRLSIIDVAGGAQPFDNEDGRCHLVANGEIYNHADLRRDLAARGHAFRSRSDAEVILHGYEEWGDDIVKRLRGMFAFAIWDRDRERLLLARDRLGKKPLVYWEAAGGLVFASELQALLADRTVPRLPDRTAIHHYLTFQYVPAPLTAFQGVRKLPPAHVLVFENGASRIERYWRLRFAPPHAMSEEDAADELLRRLREAVRIRLMSDVPLGAFLSGGLDSSTIVALMAECGPVQTFSVGFEEQEFSELRFARMVADRYATDHHEHVVRPRAADVLPKLVDHYGEPYADSSALPTYYLSQMTAAAVKVALNGDGGDELFAGYDRYKLLRPFALLGRLPGQRTLGRTLADLLDGRAPLRLCRFLRALSNPPEESYARVMSYFSPEEKQALYTPEMQASVVGVDSYELLLERFRSSDAPDLLGRALHADTLTYLPDDLLAKVDIATMAHGLEGRSPLLDHELVEFVARLPTRYKLRRLTGKRLLRKVMRGRLPAAILTRSKMGFGVPISRWLSGELRVLAEDVLLSSHARSKTILRSEAIDALWRAHVAGRRDHGARLWALLMLELWWRRFF